MVAGRDPGDAGADLLDHARALVPQHHGQPARDLPVQHVQVGMAEPGVRVADEDLALSWPGEVELLDLEGLADLVNHRCGRLHSVQSSKSAHT